MPTPSAAQTEGSSPGDSTAATTADIYEVGYRWLIKGPIDVVFDVLSHANDFPDWWAPCFKSVESDATEPAVGNKARMRVRSQLPYELVWDVTVVQLDRPTLIETDTIVRLSGRFPLRGPVRYTLTEGPDGVEVINHNILYAERHLPRPLRALTQRAFSYNHAWACKIGGRGLQKAVDEVVAARLAAAA